MSDIKVTVGSRLKEERSRLGLTQPHVGEYVGATKETVINWEKGKNTPSAESLIALASLGFDMVYILTGMRSNLAESTLNRREQALLDNYRHSPDEGQRAIEATASALSQSTKASSKKRA